jgi:NTE family protein
MLAMAAEPTEGWRAVQRRRRPLRLNLALQGGGAHGAFTWGVLDRLLEEDGFAFEGISGTSAGALNAVTLASGWLSGGAPAARQTLATLWHEIAGLARFSPLRAGGMTQMAADFTAQLLSPYQLNPLGLNPLRKVLGELVDFERLQAERGVALFVAATDLRSGAARIFRNRELSADALLASACLPQLHQAVAIDGAAYWDGGFASNPPLVPLVEGCRTRDVLLVQINPTRVAALPRSARDIRNRMGEIVFGRPLLAELEMLAERARRARSPLGWWSRAGRRLARHRLHLIDGGALLAELDPTTKIDPDWTLLLQLRDLGRAAAEAWLGAGRGRPGRRPAPAPATASPRRPPAASVAGR